MRKTLFFLLIAFTLILSGGYFYLKTKITPSNVKNIIKKTIENKYPKSNVIIGSIDISIGARLLFSIEDIIFNHQNKKLVSTEKVEVKVPLWLLILRKGNVSVSLEGMNVNFLKNKQKTNFDFLLSGEKSEGKKNSFDITKYAGKNSISLTLKDTNINYKIDTNKGNLNLKRVYLKNINFQNDLSYEVFSKFEDKNLNSNILIIGETNLSKFLIGEKLVNKFVLNLSETYFKKFKISIPNTKLKGSIVVGNQIRGDFQLKVEDSIESSFSFSKENENISIKKFNSNLDLHNLMKISRVNNLDLKEGTLEVFGSMEIKKNKIFPSIKIKTNKDIKLKVNNFDIISNIEGKVNEKSSELKFKNNLLGGVVSGSISNDFNINNIPKDITKLNPLKLDLILTNIMVPEISTENKKNDKKSEAKKDEVKVLIPVDGTISWKNLKFKEMVSKGAMAINLNKDSFSVESSQMYINQAKLDLLFKGQIKKSYINGTNQVDIKNFNISLLESFFPKGIKKVKGTFDGSLIGNYKVSKRLKFNQKFRIFGKEGDLGDINIKNLMSGLEGQLPGSLKALVPKTHIKTNAFEKLSVQGNLSDEKIQIIKSHVYAPSSRIELFSNGTVYLKENKALGSDVKRVLEKNFSTDELHFLLVGPGLNMTTDYSYTTKILSKQALKKVEKKVKKKIKKKVEDKVKKILKNDVKKIFKSIF